MIHIYGASGSGTSTLGKNLATAMGLFFMDADDYFWLPTDPPFTTARPAEERVRLMREHIDSHEGAVISGSLSGWGDPLIPSFTLAIRLVTDTETRLARIREREYARFGERIRPGGDMAEAHQAFLRWAAQYDAGDAKMRSRLHHDLWQQCLPCPLLTLDGTRPLPELVDAVRQFLEGPLLRPVQPGEEGCIQQLYQAMIGSPFCTWNEHYPTIEDIRLDMAGNGLFALVAEEQIIGAISAVPENELDGLDCWAQTAHCREIARVVIALSHRGRGMAGRMLTQLEERLQRQGARAIHLLVEIHHEPAQRLYLRHGYVVRGQCSMYGHEYLACEKLLS